MSSLETKLKLDRENIFDAVTEAYLTRLAIYQVQSWPTNVEVAVEAILSVVPPKSLSLVESADTQTRVHVGLWVMPLSEALKYWKKHRKPSPSAISAATKSVLNFIHLFGDLLP